MTDDTRDRVTLAALCCALLLLAMFVGGMIGDPALPPCPHPPATAHERCAP